MFELFAANAATVMIGGLLLASVIFAARSVFRKAGKGGCAGCGGGCGCGETKHSGGCGAHPDMKK